MNVTELIPASAAAAELMRSLSHPQRLLVLCALGDEEKSVTRLREELGGVDQVPMSQQLMRLRADGLVTSRREGTIVYYRIAKPEVIGIIQALHHAFCPPGAPKSGGGRSRSRKTQLRAMGGRSGDRG
jgi:DNA-binding transcriptional ArsR family regulator